jgi:hypothetical protein
MAAIVLEFGPQAHTVGEGAKMTSASSTFRAIMRFTFRSHEPSIACRYVTDRFHAVVQ